MYLIGSTAHEMGKKSQEPDLNQEINCQLKMKVAQKIVQTAEARTVIFANLIKRSTILPPAHFRWEPRADRKSMGLSDASRAAKRHHASPLRPSSSDGLAGQRLIEERLDGPLN